MNASQTVKEGVCASRLSHTLCERHLIGTKHMQGRHFYSS